MATPMRATTTFFVGWRCVQAGDIVNSDDPVVRKNAIYFEPVETPDIVVEQATAAPGERRRTPSRPRRS